MLDENFVGRALPPSPPYQVGREKIREFATAVGEHSPLCHEVAAARAAGYPDLVAPPSFPVVFTMPRIEAFLREPAFGWRFEGTVHGDQKIVFSRPIHAGDELVTVVHVVSLRTRAGTHMLTLRCAVSDAAGGEVCETEALLLSQEQSS
ncbi:MAG TPA: MaoC family dehydratase N-terminal domain-containing protein [Pseudonocardia sp.]